MPGMCMDGPGWLYVVVQKCTTDATPHTCAAVDSTSTFHLDRGDCCRQKKWEEDTLTHTHTHMPANTHRDMYMRAFRDGEEASE